MTASIKILCDATPLQAAVDDFFALLAAPNSDFEIESLGKLRHLLRKLVLEGALDFAKLIHIESKLPALVAGEVTLCFKPTEFFLDLLAALRARDGDLA